jgi:5-methylcytosine-specific restriction endonuclease McrA
VLCAIENCGRLVSKREWCNRHYLRWRRHGDPLAGRPPWDEFTIPTEKACRNCGALKPLDQFATRSAARDGKSPWCKACFLEYSRAHYYPDKRSSAERYQKLKPYFQAYYAKNRQKKIDNARAWVLANPERRKEWEQKYSVESREKINAQSREYQRRTGHKYSRARELAKRTRVVEKVDRREVFARAAGLCGLCGEGVDVATFHIDHIIPLARGGEHSYANTQPAHPLCNLRKGARSAA